MSARTVAAARGWSTELSDAPSSPRRNLIEHPGSKVATSPHHLTHSRYHRAATAGGKAPIAAIQAQALVEKHKPNLAHAQHGLQLQTPVSPGSSGVTLASLAFGVVPLAVFWPNFRGFRQVLSALLLVADVSWLERLTDRKHMARGEKCEGPLGQVCVQGSASVVDGAFSCLASP